jgi:hypothetical protein
VGNQVVAKVLSVVEKPAGSTSYVVEEEIIATKPAPILVDHVAWVDCQVNLGANLDSTVSRWTST